MLTPAIVLGAIAMIVPFPLAAWLGIRSWLRWRKRRVVPTMSEGPLGASSSEPPPAGAASQELVGSPSPLPTDPSLIVAFAGLWVVLSFFPVSNIPVLLPTVRAERFWYFPVIGTSLLVGVLFGWLVDRVRVLRYGPTPKYDFELNEFGELVPKALEPRRAGVIARRLLVAGVTLFFVVQAIAARNHANDYTDDLAFWDATRKAVPRSAKAHLNYSVMKGARGDLEERLAANGKALELAPQWPMASVYYGDTLCRLHRAPEAWPHYARGFELAPNDVNLIALGVQCLWDERLLTEGSNVRTELDALKDKHPGSWLDFIAKDVFEHGEEHNGVDPKYRPRGYNEGPKD